MKDQQSISASGIPFHPILMHFAARYVGATYRQFASDHRVLVEANIRCREDFETDCVWLISDPFRETAAFGGEVTFPEDGVPQCRTHLVRTMVDVLALTAPDVHASERTRDRIEGARLYRERLGDEVPLIGWVEGPLAEACDLAGVNEILLNLMFEPDFVRRLMNTCLATAKDFARAQIEAGCDIIGVGDAICSQISPDSYREMVLPLHQELFTFIREQGAQVKLHICGNITHLLDDLATLPIDILDLDWMVDMDAAFARTDGAITLAGNLNPVAVIRDRIADDVYAAARDLTDRFGAKRYILSGGCEITADTPHENLHALRRAAQLAERKSGT